MLVQQARTESSSLDLQYHLMKYWKLKAQATCMSSRHTELEKDPFLVVRPRKDVVMGVASTQRYVMKCATFNWTCVLIK